MTRKFDIAQIKTLMQLNLASIIIIGFCEIFAIAAFISKGFVEGIERWKFIVYIVVVVVISLLLVASIVLFIYFLKLKKKNKY
jgi:uncharacterized membrane protein